MRPEPIGIIRDAKCDKGKYVITSIEAYKRPHDRF